MDFQHRLARSFKPRFAVIYPLGLYMFVFGSCNDASLRTGIGYVLAGLLIRLWSNGYAIKNDKLTTSGPYAFVRNPLYLGTFLIAVGMAVILKTPWEWLEILLLIAMMGMYIRTIRDEQGMLLAKFGDAYRNYMHRVPAMLPTLVPYGDGEKWPFSLKRLVDSKEHKVVIWIIVLLIFFHIKSRLIIAHNGMTAGTWTLAATAAFLILLDVLYEINKKTIHTQR